MFINANSITINGINMGQYLLSAKYEYNKLWGNDTRKKLSRQVYTEHWCGIFPKIILTFRRLTVAEMNIIAPILDSASQTLTYYDPNTNTTKTLSTYTGDWSYKNDTIVTKNESFECSFISRERRA